MKTGTLVDATIIASASENDGEGHWVKHKGKSAVHGLKPHVGANADTALVEEIAVTSANVNDGKADPDALPGNLGDVYADSAYRGDHFGKAVITKGGRPRVIATGMWGRDETEVRARLDAWNQPIHRIRSRIEKIFGTWKRIYGLQYGTGFKDHRCGRVGTWNHTQGNPPPNRDASERYGSSDAAPV